MQNFKFYNLRAGSQNGFDKKLAFLRNTYEGRCQPDSNVGAKNKNKLIAQWVWDLERSFCRDVCRSAHMTCFNFQHFSSDQRRDSDSRDSVVLNPFRATRDPTLGMTLMSLPFRFVPVRRGGDISNETDWKEVAVNFFMSVSLEVSSKRNLHCILCLSCHTNEDTVVSEGTLCPGKRKEPLFRSRDQKKRAEGTEQRKRGSSSSKRWGLSIPHRHPPVLACRSVARLCGSNGKIAGQGLQSGKEKIGAEEGVRGPHGVGEKLSCSLDGWWC